jgi:hypothetical protein
MHLTTVQQPKHTVVASDSGCVLGIQVRNWGNLKTFTGVGNSAAYRLGFDGKGRPQSRTVRLQSGYVASLRQVAEGEQHRRFVLHGTAS